MRLPMCGVVLGVLAVIGIVLGGKTSSSSKCQEKSLTTASGGKAPAGPFCPGDLIFEDTFDGFDLDTWQHENTLAGNTDSEFQWFTNNRSNSFVREGNLFIRPTLTVDEYGEAFLRSGVLNIHGSSPAEQCTKHAPDGCVRTGTHGQVLNPVKSASIRTVDSFAFKYGKVEVSAKLPAGDWLWPAIWFLPKVNAYGRWPASGEIDLLESKGNRELIKNGINVGIEQVSSTLKFGPDVAHGSGYGALGTSFTRNSESGKGYHTGFHRYQMEWTPDHVTFSINDIETGTVKVGTGFWQKGNFNISTPGLDNPWRYGSIMAPFDQEFYFKISIAVGGSDYFSDDDINPTRKPWQNGWPHAMTDFWNGKNDWLPTWKLDDGESKDASLQVDYVRVWSFDRVYACVCVCRLEVMSRYVTVRLVIASLLLATSSWVLEAYTTETTTTEAGTSECVRSVTTASGALIDRGRTFCSGELIFEDNFDFFDFEKWEHENTLAGGGNWEFQWYTNNRSNSFVENGELNIRPTLTSDQFGEAYLTSGTLSLQGNYPDHCTNDAFYGCVRVGNQQHIVNPVKSARIRTIGSFNFKYGRAKVRAKIPTGDWLWPAIWLLPKRNVYGSWPVSGEMDLMESRGNEALVQDGVQIGTAQVGQTLHFGPSPSYNGYPTATLTKNALPGQEYNKQFSTFGFVWTPDNITVSINGEALATIGGDFWKRGDFAKHNLENPWRYGTHMAPFDQEFHFVINLAVGGVAYFPDTATNPGGKPWKNNSPQAATDFWNGRDQWLPTWNLAKDGGKSASLLVDYVKVWAL
ncbi:uncharacterized protein LOC128722392 [Anopheles nili]|uniref:uncharacterized protein LOC128722392 n=1 Tax=Anopheles nili TaxID=185578 RepID=UPI00237A788B|nr:uncharacterized protein LOC128722392 [Anopheles nili]